MDEPAALKELLSRFTYRPGWDFNILRERDTYILHISADVVDSDNPHKIAPLQFAHGIPQFVPPAFDWQRWLLDMIMEVERHECREFFKIDGVKVYDPHG